MRKKGFSLCLAAITCVSLLAGCGEKAKESQTADNTSAVQTQEQEAADEQNGEVIQLKFTSWSAGGEQKAVKQALASFEEQNPGIKVEAEFIDNANYTAKINTLMAAGDAPNVAQLNGYLAPEYGAKGQLLDLKPYLEGQVDFEDIHTEGITKITPTDIKYAQAMGRAIKLLATSKKGPKGYTAIVAPFLLPASHPLYAVNGVFNAIFVHGNVLGDAMFYGSGAGKLPTASAVVADVVEMAKNLDKNIPIEWSSKKLELVDYREWENRFFIRTTADKVAV